MAATKEALVIIVDVGKHSGAKNETDSETFLEKEKMCCMKILQRKLFGTKKDEVGFLLMGTNETQNELNSQMEGYDHICEAHSVSLPNWSMIRALENCLKYEGASADWLDALIVAMDVLRREKDAKKFGNLKIVLFSTFSTYVNDDNVNDVIQGLKSMDIELVVISDNIEIPKAADEDKDDDIALSQGIFTQKENKSQHQKNSEELIAKIVEESDGYLCNFDFAINHLMNFQRKKSRPFFWYTTLDIGSEFKIQVRSTILIKQETHFSWKTESARENLITKKVIEFFKDGEKADPHPDDLIKGYMVGSSPLAFDESLGITSKSAEKCLKCLHFCNIDDVPCKYWSGSGTNLVLPKQNQPCSEKMFVSLVNAMKEMNMAMIARRVYNNGTKPKIVVLLPIARSGYPCLLMYELLYADQLTYWYFPLLESKKTQPSQEQYDAIDKLIDSMNLMDGIDGEDGPSEAFPHRHLLNISLQYIYETITKRAINPKEPVSTLDGRLHEVLKQPQKIKERSVEPLKNVKELFKLERKQKTDKKSLVRRLGAISSQAGENPDGNAIEIPEVLDVRQLVEVGTVCPAEDFIILLEKGEHFTKIALQIQNVINDLVFKSMLNQDEKIARAIATYREQAIIYNPCLYSDWIKGLKETVIIRKKYDFWENIIVKEKLGLISGSESELEIKITDEDAQEFYKISTGPSAPANNEIGETVDDLFDMM